MTALIQFALQSYFFPIGELLSQTPLHYIDSAYHQYQMELGRLACAAGRAIAYDPYFAAGYLGGVSFNSSAKVPTLIACLSGSSDAIVPIYKGFTFWAGIIAPIAFAATGIALKLDLRASTLIAACGLILWWTGPMRWYHTAGLVSWVTAAYVAVPFSVALARVVRSPQTVSVTLCALGSAAGLLLHPLFPVAVMLLTVPLLLGHLREIASPVRSLLAMAAIGTVALALNAWWIQPTFTLPGLANTQAYQRVVDPLLILREPLGHASTAAGGSRFYLALLLGAAAALWLSHTQGRRTVTLFMTAFALTMLWASVGAIIPGVANLQPNRFSALAWLILVIPASLGIMTLVHRLRSLRGAQKLASVALLTGFTGIFALFVKESSTEIFGTGSGRYAIQRPEVKGKGPDTTALVEWIRSYTDDSARIYFENSLGRVHDHTHVAGILALETRREFIGGPYPFSHFASAWDGFAFGRPLEQFSAKELLGYLDLYNVGWLLCHTDRCRRAMSAVAGVREAATFGRVTAFTRTGAPGYFVVGKGSIRSRGIDRLEVETEGGAQVVLRYHWVPGLASDPPARIEPTQLPGDPKAFILVRDPPRRFTLHLANTK